jgi:hypothetical protein
MLTSSAVDRGESLASLGVRNLLIEDDPDERFDDRDAGVVWGGVSSVLLSLKAEGGRSLDPSWLIGLSNLPSKLYLDPATLLLPSELLPPEDGAPSAFNLAVTSSSKLMLRKCWFGVPTFEAFVSLNTFPTPSKNPVMFRTRSSLALKHSLKSDPTVLQYSDSSEFPSPNSPLTSALICSSKARFVPLRRRTLSLSVDCTMVWAALKSSGIVFVVVCPFGGNLDRWDSKIESESIMSFPCSPEFTRSRVADRGVPASCLNDGEYGEGYPRSTLGCRTSGSSRSASINGVDFFPLSIDTRKASEEGLSW